MDVKFVNAFIGSIINVFKTMVHVDVKVGKPAIREAKLVSAEVSGVIGLSGDIVGSVVLSFPGDSATKLASAFAGAPLTLDSPDFADAIGELANMVAGNAKKDFDGYNASISLPSVIIGPGHSVSQSKVWPFLVIPCETPLGLFSVEIALKTIKRSLAGQPALAGAVQ
jgi:chemotaxis protein CheX